MFSDFIVIIYHVPTHHRSFSRSGTIKVVRILEQGRFACAIWSDKAQTTTFLNFKVDIVQSYHLWFWRYNIWIVEIPENHHLPELRSFHHTFHFDVAIIDHFDLNGINKLKFSSLV